MAFRFVHTADLHLDSPLRSLAERDAALADLVATREAFRNICRLCIEEEAEALLIAGDLYDGDQTSMKTGAFLAAELSELADRGVKTFIVRGNHDACSRLTESLDLPAGVHAFQGGRKAGVETFEARDGSLVAVHGYSFAKEHIEESLLPRYEPPVAGAFNIGLMHTSLDGPQGHDPYAPTSLEALFAHGFDYWALGHIHMRAAHERDGRAVVMPGIPQGRHVNEAGAKSVTLATVDDAGLRLEERSVAMAAFARRRLDLPEAEDLGTLRRAVRATLEEERQAAEAPHLIARLELRTSRPLAWRLARDRDAFTALAREAAKRLEGVWIEQASVEAARPPEDTESAIPVAELGRAVEAALAAPDFAGKAAEWLEELVGSPQFPRELAHVFGGDEAAERDTLAELGRDGAAAALARAAFADDGQEAED